MRSRASDPLLFAPKPAHNGTRTSRDAAIDVATRAPTCRQRILDRLRFWNWAGGTHEQIAAETEIRLDTVKARIHELGELGLVRALAETRPTSSGSQALVFVLPEFVGTRELEPWPVKRRDWRQEAIDQERRAIDAEKRIEELERRLSARPHFQESAA